MSKKGIVEIVASLAISLYAFFVVFNGHNGTYLDAFIFGFLGSATIFLPSPAFFVVFSLARYLNPLAVGVLAGVGSGLGELVAFLGGKGVRDILKRNSDNSAFFHRHLQKYGAFAVFFFAFIPNPFFDGVGLLAGGLGMDWKLFFIACVIGRVLRYVFLAYLGLWSVELL